MYSTALTLWAAFLIGAVFYTDRARNPQTPRLAAYLIFSAIFTMGSFVLFAVIIVALGALRLTQVLDKPIAAAVFLIIVFIPAFLIARWQLRKPPRPQERL